jgi:voltage-gated potassium channel
MIIYGFFYNLQKEIDYGKIIDKRRKAFIGMEKFKMIWKKFHITALFIVISVYLLLVTLLYFVLKWNDVVGANGKPYTFLDVLIFNVVTLAGNDYEFIDNNQTRLLGIIFLAFGTIAISMFTGYISSAFVEKRLNQERSIKKMQQMKNHILILGYKNDLKALILDIIRKNDKLKMENIILINNLEQEKLDLIKEDKDFKNLNILKGDYTIEQTLLNANVKEASKVLIIGENIESLDDELIDSRIFVTALMVRNLNSKCHICCEVRTKRYRDYLLQQNCAEVVYSEEYTRYILSTSTNYSGMSKVMSSFLDNGDGTSVQIIKIEDQWVGKKYKELFDYYKNEKKYLLIGVLENMGVEKELKHQILSDAQKSTNYGEIIQKMKNIKNIEMNNPRLNPQDDFILDKNMGAIILGEEK